MSQPRVIVIDDDETSREVLCQFLNFKGIKVLAEGANGKVAFDLFREYKPDLVLMDIVMPETDGFYGLEQIIRFDSKAKVIFVSDPISNLSKEKVFKSKACGVVFKPFDSQRLLKLIERTTKELLTC